MLILTGKVTRATSQTRETASLIYLVKFEQMGTEENNVEDSLNIEVISNGKGDRGKEET